MKHKFDLFGVADLVLTIESVKLGKLFVHEVETGTWDLGVHKSEIYN